MLSASSRSRKSTRTQWPVVVLCKRANISSASSCMRLSLIRKYLASSSDFLCFRGLHRICRILRIRRVELLNGKIVGEVAENAHLTQAILHGAQVLVSSGNILGSLEHIGRAINQDAVVFFQKAQEVLQANWLDHF